MESKKGGRLWERVPLAEKRKEIKCVWFESTLLLHVSAVGQQLFGSSVAPNRFSVSDTRLCRIITQAKLIKACFVLIRIHAQLWHFSRPPLSGRLTPTCHTLFHQSSTSCLPPTPFYFFLSSSLSLLLCHDNSISSSSDAPQRHHPAALGFWLPTAALNSPQADLNDARLGCEVWWCFRWKSQSGIGCCTMTMMH